MTVMETKSSCFDLEAYPTCCGNSLRNSGPGPRAESPSSSRAPLASAHRLPVGRERIRSCSSLGLWRRDCRLENCTGIKART